MSRSLDLHRYPRPLLIQACFRHLPELLFRPQSSIHSRHETVRSPHPQTRPSTPISNKTSGNHSYASETHNRDFANYRLAHETGGYFLGTIPPTVAREFMVCFWITAIEILNSVSGWGKFSVSLRQCYACWLCFDFLYYTVAFPQYYIHGFRSI